MELKSQIMAINSRIASFVRHHNNGAHEDRSKGIAIKRYCGKFEEPNRDTATKRRTDAWERWITFDSELSQWGVLGPRWAKARLIIKEILSDFRMGELSFTNGSSFVPLGPLTSVACRLTADWTVTPDCFDLFAKYAYWHKALKVATKKRFTSYCRTNRLNERKFNKFLWRRWGSHPDGRFEIFKFKLNLCVTYVAGNRWSTVPKNNLKDRPICLEPLCNMFIQRAVGLGIRTCLKNKLGIDLDHLADVHRNRIKSPSLATIDLSDCSDAISVRLIKYLLPFRVLNKVLASRSDMTLAPDDSFYVVKKVSSMGNGFTFDLMSLILTALARSLDENATVFGDDIIVDAGVARELVEELQRADFVINMDKTNIGTGYRESCGAHFVDGHGYVTAFDQRWLTDDHDLIVAANKVAILASVYGEPFSSLRADIWSMLPPILLGATVARPTVISSKPPSYELDCYIRYGPVQFYRPTDWQLKVIRRGLRPIQKPGRISTALGIIEKPAPPSKHLRSTDWDMFYQNIRAGRCGRRVPRSVRKSTLVARVGEEQIGFVHALLP